jgi:hypothetical protein
VRKRRKVTINNQDSQSLPRRRRSRSLRKLRSRMRRGRSLKSLQVRILVRRVTMMIRVNRGSLTKRSSKRRRRTRRRGQRSKEVIRTRVTRVKRVKKKLMTLVFHQVRGS